jgi:hypothetical protein
MDLDILVSGYHSIMRTIYKPSEYYQRVLNSLRETSTVQPEVLNYTLLRAITSLSHIFFKLGVLDRERREFWRFMVQAMKEHRNRMADLFRLAAVGYHFRKLSEQYDS